MATNFRTMQLFSAFFQRFDLMHINTDLQQPSITKDLYSSQKSEINEKEFISDIDPTNT